MGFREPKVPAVECKGASIVSIDQALGEVAGETSSVLEPLLLMQALACIRLHLASQVRTGWVRLRAGEIKNSLSEANVVQSESLPPGNSRVDQQSEPPA